MEALRTTKKFSLNIGTLQANGLFNVTSVNKKTMDVSMWFDEEITDELMKLNNDQFDLKCKELIKESEYMN